MNNTEIITHLDEILADLADEHFHAHQTTVGYKSKPGGCTHKWTIPPAGTEWSGYDLSHDAATIKLESLKAALGVTPPPPPPSGAGLRRVVVPSYSSTAKVVTSLSAAQAAFATMTGGELVIRGDIQFPDSFVYALPRRDYGDLQSWYEDGARWVGHGPMANAGQQVPAGLYMRDLKRLHQYGLDVSNMAGAGLLAVEGVTDITLQGKIHDCGGTCFMTGFSSANGYRWDVDLEQSACGQGWLQGYNKTIDPHYAAGGEGGTGVHPYYIGSGPGVYGLHDSKLTLIPHDCGTGQGQIGQTCVNTQLWVDARRLTMKATSQLDAAGHAISFFEETGTISGVTVEYVYAEDCQGRAVNAGGGTFDVTVKYGRALRCCLNPKIPLPAFDPNPGITYEDVATL
jgi:hypothetical protein